MAYFVHDCPWNSTLCVDVIFPGSPRSNKGWKTLKLYPVFASKK